jgi:excisionase family DNA binding protein
MQIAKNAGALNTSQAARYIGVSRPLLQRLLEEGSIPHRNLGKRKLISKAVLDRWLEGDNKPGEK